jgi:hypothetical protein
LKILMINDTIVINNLYRSGLKSLLKKEFSKVYCCGLFDKKQGLFFAFFKILQPNVATISSNLKSNIFTLFFFWKRGCVILNGIGRYRSSKTLRIILFSLFRLNWKKIIIIQSYADYRYFKRYSSKKYFWIPGSGGNYKKSGPKGNLLLVQRDDKIKMISQSAFKLLKTIQDSRIFIVGCHDHKMVKELFQDYKVNLVGYQRSEDIFLKGGGFIQPSGYGEGFPHTLADAIVSGLDVYIDSKEFVRYGLGRLGGGKQEISNNWYRLKGLKKIATNINSEHIVYSYMTIIKHHM